MSLLQRLFGKKRETQDQGVPTPTRHQIPGGGLIGGWDNVVSGSSGVIGGGKNFVSWSCDSESDPQRRSPTGPSRGGEKIRSREQESPKDDQSPDYFSPLGPFGLTNPLNPASPISIWNTQDSTSYDSWSSGSSDF